MGKIPRGLLQLAARGLSADNAESHHLKSVHVALCSKRKKKTPLTSSARSVLESPNASQVFTFDSMSFLSRLHRHTPQPLTMLLLFDVLVKNFRNLARALLRVSLLSTFVVDIGDAKACRVALGPFEIAASTHVVSILLIWFQRRLQIAPVVVFGANREGLISQLSLSLTGTPPPDPHMVTESGATRA